MDADAQRRLLTEAVRNLARDTGAVPLPSPLLSGWQSLCAGEYARATLQLHSRVVRLEGQLVQAAALLGP